MKVTQGCISVIVPVYNVEKYLDECINSVLSQTYQQIELILVDDGSTDCSAEICNRWAEKDSRVKVIHSKNQGVSVARNKGIQASEGEYLFFCDSDDYLEDNAFENLHSIMVENNADMVISNYRRVADNKVLEEKKMPFITGTEVITEEQFWKGVNYYLAYVVVWSKLYRREIWQNLSFLEGIIHEDQEILHKICTRVKRIAVTDKVLYNYRDNNDSIMNQSFRVQNLDYAEHILKRMDYFLEKQDVENAMFSFGVGTRLILKAYEKLNLKDIMVKKRIKDLHYAYRKIAKRLQGCDLSLKEKMRLTLFRTNIHLYKLVKKATQKDASHYS